ncbi:MAG: hypothetical protein KDA47_11600 [Planctomycetales bacterium]|nr:hypothetical protein [Planctomycetales bacterium]
MFPFTHTMFHFLDRKRASPWRDVGLDEDSQMVDFVALQSNRVVLRCRFRERHESDSPSVGGEF